MSISRGGDFEIRVVSAYFPHAGYKDIHVQTMYDTLENINAEAKKQKMCLAIGMDANAQVGLSTEDDDYNTVGQYGLHPMNVRGQWLKNWAAIQGLTLQVQACPPPQG